MPGVTAQSPMKLRILRSSVLCGNAYPVRVLASRGCADGASDSPTPSSFPPFICLQIPCSTSRTLATINSCLQVSFFFTKKKKNEKEVGNLRQVDRLCEWQAHHAKPDEAPLPMLPSAAPFIGSLLESISRPSPRFAGCADGASDSPTPSSFPSFICLQIPCSVFRRLHR